MVRTDHFVELDLSAQVRLDVVTEVSDAVLMKMLRLGHETVRYDVHATFCFLQLPIKILTHVFLVLQLCHDALTTTKLLCKQ